ncbi:MAG TPA: lamin tail domain-containing protein [Gammaproteobacteria bacterium]|nr:lamin tail domain-containing protein [Gammaproteobacteria bacterium]
MKGIVSVVAATVLSSFLFASASAHASTSGVVVSQIYGGGGNSGAVYTHDYVEIFNAGSSTVDISGWSVQYASTAGSNWSGKSTIPASTTLQPGQYYLLQEQSGSGTGTATEPSYDPADGTFNMAAGHGNIALVSNDTDLSGTCPTGGAIVDFVGFGTAACHEGSGTAAAADDNTGATIRNGGGCADTDDNTADFTAGPAAPHNSSSDLNVCSGPTGITARIADVGHDEGDSGTTAYDFVVTLSTAAPAGGVTFDITTSDGTATTADSDYVANSATGMTIAEGATTATYTVQVNGDTTAEQNETFTVTASNFSDADSDITTTTTSATGTIYNDDAVDATIAEIQGNPSTQGEDGASPLVGQLVHTSGIVTAVGTDGFYIQTPDAEADSDPLTSEAVYVYDPSPTVVSGDAVELDGEVSEYYAMTELGFVTNLTVTSEGNPMPTAVQFDASTPSSDPMSLSCGNTNFECFESMLVAISDGMVTQPADSHGNVYATANGQRSRREPGLLFGLTPTAGDNDQAGVWDGNPEVFKMIPDYFGDVGGGAITGRSQFSATGVLGYDFGAYTFYPRTLSVNPAPVLRPVPISDPVMLTIGEFNVERFCDDVDDTDGNGDGSELGECADSLPSSEEYDTKTQRIADYLSTVLDLPDVVALEEVENIGALTKLADKLNGQYPSINYVPKLLEGNDIGGIDVGYLVNTTRVRIDAVEQLGMYEYWTTPKGHWRPIFDHPPLVLHGTFIAGGMDKPFMVMVNHMKARQSVDDVTSTGAPTAEANEDNLKRLHQAYSTANHVQDLQSGNPGVPLLVVGDFNTYQFADGYVDIIGMISGTYQFGANLYDLTDMGLESDSNVVSPTLWNAVLSVPEDERYSYLFSADLGKTQGGDPREVPTEQVLDHALLNKPARALFARMDFGHANEGASYDVESSSTGPIGVSDHDGFVVQLTFDRIFKSGFENQD